ncbi:hypothetical protein ABBQ38_011824 [Trebouxia sp. C0009 RCD-2024]
MHSLLATSSKGLFAFTLTGDVTPVGLQGTVVSQTTARNGIVLAAVPAIQEVHKMMSYGDSDSSRRQPGLYMFDLAGGDANDVVISEDMGATWADTDSFKALPARDSWTFPAEPHKPHTLSIDFASNPAAGPQAAAEDVVMAGIEVGGCLVSSSDGMWETRHGSGQSQLCVDVHQLRPDPFDANRWYATCGATPQLGISGGCFVTEDQGATWRRLFDGGPGQQQAKGFAEGQGYAIGLALNPFRQGELLVTAGDRPPGIGVHVHHSINGGESFNDITDTVYGAEELKACKGGHTPVPYFIKEGALLGSDTGDILICKDVGKAGWQKACQLPGHITTITAIDRSPSSVIH